MGVDHFRQSWLRIVAYFFIIVASCRLLQMGAEGAQDTGVVDSHHTTSSKPKLTSSLEPAPLTATHHCDLNDPLSCSSRWNRHATNGTCVENEFGTRCECPPGWMGRRCERPCQDVYRSCEKWSGEGRCGLLLPFFADNCASTCGVCEFVKHEHLLANPLPVVLEPLAWLVGRWTTSTIKGYRFPQPFGEASGEDSPGYRETWDITLAEVPMFDRPVLNISVHSISSSNHGEQHTELGFISIHPAKEETGFIAASSPTHPLRGRPTSGGDERDLIAIQLSSNNGLLTIEEGDISHLSMVIAAASAATMVGGKGKKTAVVVNDEINLAVRQFWELPASSTHEEPRLANEEELDEGNAFNKTTTSNWDRTTFLKSVKRRIRYVAKEDIIEERLTLVVQNKMAGEELGGGKIKKILKKFRRVKDYLKV